MSDIAERLRSPDVFIANGLLISPVAYEGAARIEALEAEIKLLRAALEFYGNPDHWKSGGWDRQFRMMSPEPVYSDKGDKARAALEGKHD